MCSRKWRWPPAIPHCPTCGSPLCIPGQAENQCPDTSWHLFFWLLLSWVEKVIQILCRKPYLWLDNTSSGFETTHSITEKKRKSNRQWNRTYPLSGRTPSVRPKYDASWEAAGCLKRRCSTTPKGTVLPPGTDSPNLDRQSGERLRSLTGISWHFHKCQ